MSQPNSPTSNRSGSSTHPSETSTIPTGRCKPDPLNPFVFCDAKVTTDDRQCVSHFFGRNKKATSSIPDDMFPLLCRRHYQEKKFRWKDEPFRFAAFQCTSIAITLERMSKKTWIDEHGLVWPYWCGFELQLQKDGIGVQDEAILPAWLRRLCNKEAVGQQFRSVGDRNGARCSFAQLDLIVLYIKAWCVQTKAKLPPVEALPITFGMVDAEKVKQAKKDLQQAEQAHQRAWRDLQNAMNQNDQTRSARQMTKLEQATRVERETRQTEQAAREKVKEAEIDAESSKATLPVKRQSKRKATPETSTTPLPVLSSASV